MGSMVVTAEGSEVGSDIARKEDVWYTMGLKQYDGVW
jgi:hypothetical protein